MSGQRYFPPNENRFRDRSPPRQQSDRYAPGPSHIQPHGFRGGDLGSRIDGPPVNRDVPRGPRGGSGEARGGLSFAPRGRGYAPRGDYRGGEFRDREPLRPRDVTPPGLERASWRERDFDRRDRRPLSPRSRQASGDLRDFRENPSRESDLGPPRRNSRDNTFGNAPHFLDNRPPLSAPIGRGGFGRGRGRGDWESRGRGRGGFHDNRGDLFASRSRSPGGFRRPNDINRDERPPFEKSEDRRFERREEERAAERDAREKEAERYKRDQLSSAPDSKRPSAPSTGASTPHQPTFTSVPAFGARMPEPEHGIPAPRRGPSAPSLPPPPPPPPALRDARFKPDVIAGKDDTNKDRFTSRASSPLQAPQVPAFGSLPFKAPPSADPHWNVWRAPVVETKATPPAPPPISTSNLSKPPLANTTNAPRATPTRTPHSTRPSPISSTSVSQLLPPPSRIEVPVDPPTAPRADRQSEPPMPPMRKSSELQTNQTRRPSEVVKPSRPPSPSARQPSLELKKASQIEQIRELVQLKSPPTQPRQMSMIGTGNNFKPEPPFPPNVPKGPSLKSPIAAPSMGVPLGPRGAALFASPSNTLGFVAPTGPKAARIPTGPTPRAPAVGQPLGTNWHWNRPAPPNQQRATSIIPAKRDADGEERRRSASTADTPRFGSLPSPRISQSEHILSRQGSREANVMQQTEKWRNAIDEERPPMQLSELESKSRRSESKQMTEPEQVSAIATLVEQEDAMDLDEGDFAANEMNFEKEKTLLESRKVDLSTRYLRGSSPLEQLALLSRLSLECAQRLDERAIISLSRQADLDLPAPDELLTPKAEDAENVNIRDDSSSPIVSRRFTQSPAITSLPFLNRDPLTPISDLDAFQDNAAKHEGTKQLLITELHHQMDLNVGDSEDLRREYRELYRPWRRMVQTFDREKEREERDNVPVVESGPAVVVPEVSPTAITPAALESRRSRGFLTDHDLQLVMQESVELEREAQAKREREALRARPDLDKEAILPNLLTNAEQELRIFKDTSGLRDPRKAIDFYELEPLKDNFTPLEHELLVQNFKEFPKKWGKLAQTLPGRTYKECINHYYATKWSKEYKPPKDKRRGRAAKTRPRGGTQGRPKANALISNLGGNAQPEAYDGDETNQNLAAVTDSGRPRRAAAPTFGEKEMDEVAAPARRGGRAEMGLDGTSEKTGKRPRVMNKEKPARKPKVIQTRQPTMSPEKVEQDVNASVSRMDAELAARELEVLNGLAQLHAGQIPSVEQRRVNSGGFNVDTYASNDLNPDDTRMLPGQQNKVGPSSYWSVQEVTIFPTYLAHFGTDWQAIATQMGTKTQTMVKNYYYRMINSSLRPDLEDMANKANERKERGETAGLPPTPSMSVATVRSKRPEPTPTTTHRVLAPSKESEMDDDMSAIQKLAAPRKDFAQAPSTTTYQPLIQSSTPQISTIGLPEAQQGQEAARINAINEVILQDTRQRYAPREDLNGRPVTSQYPTPSPYGAVDQPHNQLSRPDPAFDFHTRRPPNLTDRNHWLAPSSVEMAQTNPGNRRSSLASYHQDTLPRHQIPPPPQTPQPRDIPTGPRSFLDRQLFAQAHQPPPPIPPTEVRQSTSGLDQHSPHPLSSTPFYDTSRPPMKDDFRRDDFRLGSITVQPVNQSLAPPKQEPRKTSNILGLLNSDNDAPKGLKHTPVMRTQSPFQPHIQADQPPARPTSQPERRDAYGEPQRHSQPYHPSTFGQQTSAPGPPRPSSRQSYIEPMPPSSRPGWPSSGRSSFASLQQPSTTSPQPYQSHLSRAQPFPQSLHTRDNPTPPPVQHHHGSPYDLRAPTPSPAYGRPPASSMPEPTQAHRNTLMMDTYPRLQNLATRQPQPPPTPYQRQPQQDYNNMAAHAHNAGAPSTPVSHPPSHSQQPPPPLPQQQQQQQQLPPSSMPASYSRYTGPSYHPTSQLNAHRRINSTEFSPSNPSAPSSFVPVGPGRASDEVRRRSGNGGVYEPYNSAAQSWERERERQDRERLERGHVKSFEERKLAEEKEYERQYQNGGHWPRPGSMLWGKHNGSR